SRHLLRALDARIEEAGERRAMHVAEDADVVVAEAPRPDHADAEWRAQTTTPRPLSSTNRSSSCTSANGLSSAAARSFACETFSSERKNRRYARFSSRTTSS